MFATIFCLIVGIFFIIVHVGNGSDVSMAISIFAILLSVVSMQISSMASKLTKKSRGEK